MQPSNALLPIEITELGMVTDVNSDETSADSLLSVDLRFEFKAILEPTVVKAQLLIVSNGLLRL